MKKYDSFYLDALIVILLFLFIINYITITLIISYIITILYVIGEPKLIGIAEYYYYIIFLEEGTSIESVTNFLYFNLFLSICMFLSAILLIYFFKKENTRLIISTVIFLYIFGYISYYLVLNLYEDISIITTINQYLMYPDDKLYIEELKNITLDSSIVISIWILIINSLFMIMYISYTVIYRNCNILFLKRIIGEGFYSYFMKIINYVNKISLWCIWFCLFLLVFLCLIYILTGFFLLIEIYY